MKPNRNMIAPHPFLPYDVGTWSRMYLISLGSILKFLCNLFFFFRYVLSFFFFCFIGIAHVNMCITVCSRVYLYTYTGTAIFPWHGVCMRLSMSRTYVCMYVCTYVYMCKRYPCPWMCIMYIYMLGSCALVSLITFRPCTSHFLSLSLARSSSSFSSVSSFFFYFFSTFVFHLFFFSFFSLPLL